VTVVTLGCELKTAGVLNLAQKKSGPQSGAAGVARSGD
jgi:hypothetical protein